MASTSNTQATCGICSTKVVDLSMHIVNMHSKPAVFKEARDLTSEGLGEEERMELIDIFKLMRSIIPYITSL